MAKKNPEVVLTEAVEGLQSIVLDGEAKTAKLRSQLRAKFAEVQALKAQIAQEEGVETRKARQILQQMAGRPGPGAPALKIAIVGAAPSSRSLAPYNDSSWQIWAFSPNSKLLRFDAWFELHALTFLTNPRTDWAPKYLEYLRSLSVPVFMQEQNNLVPKAVQFPKDELLARFGRCFFTSTAAWMLAKAINDKAEEIGLYGTDMSAGAEWNYERPGCQYFIMVARSLGIKVTIPPQSDLDAALPLYGYGDAHPVAIRMTEHAYELRGRVAEMDKRLAAIEAERLQLMVDKSFLLGALEQNTNTRRTWFAWSGPDE